MYRQFSMSFAFENTPGQWSRCTESRMSAFCEFQQHIFRDMIPSSLWTMYEPGPLNDHCPIPNFLASTLTTPAFAKHSSLLPFLSQEMSLNIDINKILPVKVSGVLTKSLRRSLILPQSCNVVNPGKMFHSNSVESPLTSSKISVAFLGLDPMQFCFSKLRWNQDVEGSCRSITQNPRRHRLLCFEDR